jgi:hypothetical protein
LGEGQYLKQAVAAPALSGILLTMIVFPIHAYVDDWPRMFGAVAGGLLLYYGSTWFLLDWDDKQFLKRLLKLD